MNDNTALTPAAVPSPWTAVVTHENADRLSVEVWGRKYCFHGSPLPASIVTAGEELLAAPMRLVGRSGGAPLVWKSGTASIFRQNPAQATISGDLIAEDVFVNGTIRIDFDGLVSLDLIIAPHRDGAPRLEQLWLEVPLRAERAGLFTYWPVTTMGSVQTTKPVNSGALPKEGLALPFKPLVWIGWEESGLSWVEGSPTQTLLDRLVARGVRLAAMHTSWTPMENYWETDRPQEIKATVRACHARGIKVIPYFGRVFQRAPATVPVQVREGRGEVTRQQDKEQ
jgi:hypothetical protein